MKKIIVVIVSFFLLIGVGNADTTIATLEAESMATKTTGGAVTDGWNIWSNGYVENPVNFPATGSYKFVVRAYGSKANNVWPTMVLRIAGASAASTTVSSTTWSDYTFTINVTAGSKTVGAQFTNDYYLPPDDRNLIIDKITVIQIGGVADTTAPSAPMSLTATAISTSQINLSWNASTDNVGVTGYKIYRSGVEIATLGTTTYSNTGLTASTSYSYTVKAIDAAGNLSAESNTATVTTQANPPPPAGGIIDFTVFTEADPGNKITLSSSCVTAVNLSHLNSVSYVTKPMAVSGNFTHDFNLKIDVINEYTNESRYPLVWGISSSANTTHNAWANGLYVGISRNAYGTPHIKLIQMVNGAQSTLASTAEIFTAGVTRYVRISRNGSVVTLSVYSDSARTQLLSSVSGTSTFNGSYFYALSTRPINNQWVTMTASVCNLNTGVDSVLPTTPSGLTATAISANQINLSWSASTDNVGVTGYKIYRAGVEVGNSTTTSYQNTGLTPATPYSYTVKAVDAAGNLSTASNTATATTQSVNITFVQNVTYNANGQMTKLQLGDGTTKDYIYDPIMQRLTRIVTKTAANVTIQDLQYRYDGIGNIVEIIDSVNTASQTFKYDHLSRLIQANNPSRYGTKNYVYDTIGNIMQKDGKTYVYGDGPAGSHAVTSVSGSPATTFTYDLNGNMATKQEGTQITFFAYDVENRLTSVKKGTSLAAAVNVETYNYDGDGGRVKKTSYNNGVLESTTEFVGSLFEKTGSTQVLHISLGDSRIASLKSGEANFYHADHLGSANVVTNTSGVVQELIEYEPYGDFSRQDKPGAGAGVANYYFTNQFRDQKTGLYFYGARYYDPKLGRFLTPDTVIPSITNPQDLNRYSYVLNNPINRVDPTGHFSFKKFLKSFVGAFIGAAITVLTAGAGAPLWIAGMAGGAIGGAVTGGLEGGWKGALYGGLIGGALGGLAGWGGGIAQAHNMAGWYAGGLLAMGAGVAGATNSWDSFTGGLVGGYLGYQVGSGIDSFYRDGISNENSQSGIRGGTNSNSNENWEVLGIGTTQSDAAAHAAQNQTSVFYVKSRGLMADFVRASMEKFGTSIAERQFAGYLAGANGKFIYAHSEGTLLLAGAARILKVNGTVLAKTHLDWNAPGIFKSTAANLSRSIGATFDYHLNWSDPIGVLTTFNPAQSAVYGSVGLATFATFHGTKYYRNSVY